MLVLDFSFIYESLMIFSAVKYYFVKNKRSSADQRILIFGRKVHKPQIFPVSVLIHLAFSNTIEY